MPPPPPDALAALARKRVPPHLWERGESYATAGGARLVHREPSEERWMVTVPGQRVPFEVTVWPADPDWTCSCEQPACAHLAAAVAVRSSGAAVQVVAAPRVVYSLRRHPDGLMVERSAPPEALRTPEDQELNRLLSSWWGNPRIPKGILALALKALDGLALTLDGVPVRASGAPVMPRILVEDAEGRPGFRVRMVRAGGIQEAFRNGAVRMVDAAGGPERIRPIGDLDLDPDLRNRLATKDGVFFAPSEAIRLVTTFLPDLRALAEVEVRAARLPDVRKVPPRLSWDVRVDGDVVRTVARIVYGDPPLARVDRGELVRIGGAVVVRDEPAEARLVRMLNDEASMAPGVPVERLGAGAATWADGLRGGARDAVLSAQPGLRIDRTGVEPKVSVDAVGDGFRVRVDAGGVAPEALLAAWEANASLVPMLGGGWRPVPKAWLDRHAVLLAELLSARGADGAVPRAAAPLLLDALDGLGAGIPPELQALRALAGDFSAIPQVPIPPSFLGSLRGYQQQGVDWIHWLISVGMGGVLADDMGLGKTVQCLAAIAALRAPAQQARTGDRLSPCLVVAPTSVVRNWAAEGAKFAPSLKVCVYHGARRTLDTTADLILTTWALLRLDADELAAPRWDLAIFDEAQAMKNPESQVAVAARRVQARLRLAVTGTPVENRLEELWSLFHLVNPGLLGGRTAFKDRFATPIASGSRGARDQLRRRIRPFVMRRLKSEVAKDLPPRTELVLRCALDAREREIYESVRTLAKADVAKMLDGGRTMAVLEVLLRMRQAACHTDLLRGAKGAGSARGGAEAPPQRTPGAPPTSSSKVDLLLETLEEVLELPEVGEAAPPPAPDRHRALVFSQWTSMLDLVEPALRARGVGFVRLDGSTRDREAVVKAFNAPDGPSVFLLSLTAGGTGLNLVAADYVFLLDPWWNPAVEAQATDRAHRIGQTRPVVACRLVAEDTVEDRILELQARKRELANAALDEAALAKSLGKEDILALFE